MSQLTKPLSPEYALRKFRRYRHHQNTRRGVVQPVETHQLVPLHLQIITIVFFGGLLFSLLYGFWLIPWVTHHSTWMIPMPISLLPFQDSLSRSSPSIVRWAFGVAYGYQTSLSLGILYLFWPIITLLWLSLRHRKRPSISRLKRYTGWHQLCAYLILAFLLTCLIYPHQAVQWFYWLFPTNPTQWHQHHLNRHEVATFFATMLGAWIASWLLIPRILSKVYSTENASESSPGDFSIYLGKSSGKLVKRRHGAGIAPHQKVCLTDKDAALNLLILGGIGEGKTSSVIHSLLLQLMDQDCGGLIFDVKGSFHRAVTDFAELTGKEVITLGPGRQQINLIGGLKPEVAADLMGSVFAMFNSNTQGTFWVTQAANLCRGALGLLSFFPEHYTLEGLRRYIFEPAFRDELDERFASTKTREVSERDQSLIESYRSSLEMFLDCPERMQGDIRATASSALSQFTHPDIKNSFCHHTETSLALEQTIAGKVFLVEMPIADYGQTSRTIHAVIKLRWFQTMDARRRHLEWDQTRLVFFMCDEYQDLVTADTTSGNLSDVSFWDKARDTKAMGIISSQSISSFYSALGNRDLADTVLQNFRQRLCFKTEDEKTIRHLQRIVGDVQISNQTSSIQHSKSRGTGHTSSSNSTTQSTALVNQSVIDGQLMRLLDPNQVVALLNLNQRSMDDVVNLEPIFLDE